MSHRASARWMLRLLPRELREEYGGEFVALFEERLAEEEENGGRGAAFRYWLHGLADLLTTALRLNGRKVGWMRPPPGRRHPRGWLQDARHGARLLLKNPLSTAVAVLSLALGIGVSTVFFSVTDAVFLEPLPYPEADRLVSVYAGMERPGWEQAPMTGGQYFDWKEQKHLFEDIAAARDGSFDYLAGDRPERLWIEYTTANFFSLLGIEPALGRTYRPEEDVAGGDPVVVLSDGFWRRAFGGDEEILGRVIELGGERTVIGVLPLDARVPYRGLQTYGMSAGGERIDAWVPVGPRLQRDNYNYFELMVVGRLVPGLTLEQARAEANRIVAGLRQDTVTLRPFVGELLDAFRLPVLLPLLAAGLIVLIACANVANLLLARAAGRRRELAMRGALGAGRARLFRQLLTETAVLGVVGVLMGVLVAYWGMSAYIALLPDGFFDGADRNGTLEFPTSEIGIDWRALGFASGLGLLTLAVFGVLPAWSGSRSDLSWWLKSRGTIARRGLTGIVLRNGFLMAQVAFCFVLLVGAGLLINTFVRILSIDVGLDYERVLKLEVTLPRARYFETEMVPFGDQTIAYRRATPAAGVFLDELFQRVEGLPGVESATVLSSFGSRQFRIEDRPEPPPDQPNIAGSGTIFRGDYLATMGIALLRGAGFSAMGSTVATSEVLVNRGFADRFFGDGDAVGQVLVFPVWPPGEPELSAEIVGVIDDTYQFDALTEGIWQWMLFRFTDEPGAKLQFFARTSSGDPLALAEPMREAVWEVDPMLPISEVRRMEDVLYEPLSQQRFLMQLTASFAAIALLLALLGVYGVVAHFVVRRTHEIGVRMALGARVSTVVGMVLRQGLVPTLVGLAVGFAAAVGLGRVIGNLLYEVSPTDPLTYVAVAALLISVALAATYVPARRAAQVDVIETLREE